MTAPKESLESDRTTHSDIPTHVVGVGASAGGLEAIERLFRNLTWDTGMAFVIVQHLSPDFKSLMDELLARWTDMPIHRVDEGMQVQANHIYLIPPKMEITIDGDQLHLVCKNPSDGLSLPIDIFFHSLARSWQAQSVAVVLSGTGSDGSRGIRSVHEAGGLVISQSVETSKFDGMPRSAENTGVVDMVLGPEGIAETLIRYSGFPTADKTQLIDKPIVVDEDSMNRLLRLLRDECGIDFAFYKSATVMRRIERRVLLSQSVDFDDYVELLDDDRDELNSLYKDLLIGVTQFFRDPAAYDRLQLEVLPDLLKDLEPGCQFRAWVAGCATGEEAYSLAILVYELLEELNLQLDVKIFATDVHKASLDIASAGIYIENNLSEMTLERRRRFFTRTAHGYQLSPEIRQMIVFAPHNVIVDAPFTKLDFVSCRNMLIYFQNEVQARVITLFHFALKKNGVLWLGPSETLGEIAAEFATVDRHWKIYRKRRDVRLTRELSLAIPNDRGLSLSSSRQVAANQTASSMVDRSLANAYDQLLETHMPAGVLLDDQRRLVHLFGNAMTYVQLKPGRPTADALEWFPPRLRAAASGGLHRAARELETVHFNGLKMDEDENSPILRMGIQPIVSKENDATYFMITFTPMDPIISDGSTELQVGDVSSDRLTTLESELTLMRENLQSAIEELETSNEELQATNEEMVASNEELQSTNEELHSVNEELYTVNGEYQKKIGELTELTDDMNHLFEHMDAGLLFLDSDMNVRKFTPSIASVFSLLPQDLGRSFGSFTHRLNRPQLADDISSVLKTQKPFEKEIKTDNGEWYQMQIQPYRSRGRIDGVVLELFEITNIKKNRRQLNRSVEQFRAAIEPLHIGIAIRKTEGAYTFANQAFADVFATTCEKIVGKTDADLFSEPLAKLLQKASAVAIAQRKSVTSKAFAPEGDDEKITVTFTPICDDANAIDALGVRITPVKPV
ncbi:chemotaxis protein CheB [Rubripirellula tenax]|nr:chemotaxis protein CheB [Rubripirellula tenax]